MWYHFGTKYGHKMVVVVVVVPSKIFVFSLMMIIIVGKSAAVDVLVFLSLFGA